MRSSGAGCGMFIECTTNVIQCVGNCGRVLSHWDCGARAGGPWRRSRLPCAAAPSGSGNSGISVVAADVDAEPPTSDARVGPGTRSGRIDRAALEWILGFRRHGTRLVVDPSAPRGPGRASPSGSAIYSSAQYGIGVENPQGVARGSERALAVQAGILLAGDGSPTDRVRIVPGLIGPIALLASRSLGPRS
jgi:hypothetical protein